MAWRTWQQSGDSAAAEALNRFDGIRAEALSLTPTAALAERDARMREEHMAALNLLAVMHRDGGHHVEKVKPVIIPSPPPSEPTP